MALMDFIGKQFIDIIQWTESDDASLAWRFPMAGLEIQHGATLVVRESQMALFVNEGQVADVFGPGTYTLGTRTLPVLTYLANWDKLFASPFKSEVYFFSTRQRLDQKWGTPQPIAVRDPEFGAVRLRAFGNYAWRVADPRRFHTQLSGTRDNYGVADLEGQLRGLVLQNISVAIAQSRIPFLDLAASQHLFAQALMQACAPAFAQWGLALEGMTVQSISLPDTLQKALDQKIGLGMLGEDLHRLMPYQAAQSLTEPASGAGGLASAGLGLGAGAGLGQTLAQNLATALPPGGAAAAPVAPGDVMATLEKLGELKARGILTDEEFQAKKTELLKKLA